jgi:hypothetical protein
MIRFTWMQSRTQAAAVFAALVVVGIVLAVTGPNLVHIYDTSVASCRANRGPSANCVNPVVTTYSLLQQLGAVLLVVPALIGIFWGAPLVARELETGTFRLAWTQSVTRTRWLAVKLGVIGLWSMAVAGLLSLMVTWWSSPIDRVNLDRFASVTFGERGITPIGYAAFAFALGVSAGVFTRRTLPAMAITLFAFVGARLAMTLEVRPHLAAPVHANVALTSTTLRGFAEGPSGLSVVTSPNLPDAWVYSNLVVDKAGQAPTTQFLEAACPSLAAGRQAAGPKSQADFQACVANVSARFHEAVTYQPASRYWAFQWYETAIFLGVALILSGFCFWWIRRRLN